MFESITLSYSMPRASAPRPQYSKSAMNSLRNHVYGIEEIFMMGRLRHERTDARHPAARMLMTAEPDGSPVLDLQRTPPQALCKSGQFRVWPFQRAAGEL
jgi:hypothetical protein